MRAPDEIPPNLGAALSFAFLFLPPAVLALLRSGPLAFPEDIPQDRTLWRLLGVTLATLTAELAIYRVGLVVGPTAVGLILATCLFVVTLTTVTAISFLVIRRNASGLEVPIDLLDVFVFGAAVASLLEAVAGPNLGFSAEALGTRAWIAVGAILVGFYTVSLVHGYGGLPFARHVLAPVVGSVLAYSTYSALSYRVPALPYWPDPILRALASGSVFLIPLVGARERERAPRAQRRYETYRISLGFLAVVLVVLLIDTILEHRTGVAASLQAMIVAITASILARQYLSYRHGKHLLHRAVDAAERYTALVEEAPDPIVELDPEGRVTLVNSAFCETFMISAEVAVGRSLAELIERSPFDFQIAPEAKEAPPPDGRQRARGGRRPRGAEPSNVVRVRFRTPEGERVFEGTGRQAPSLELQLILRDVTERIRLDDQIEELSERMAELERARTDLLIKLFEIFEEERKRTAKALIEGPAHDVQEAASVLEEVAVSARAEEGAQAAGTTEEKAEGQEAGVQEATERLKMARSLLGRAVQNLRKAVDELRPTVLEQKGLEAAARTLVNEVLRGSLADVELRWEAHPRLSQGQENLLYSALRDILLEVKAKRGLRSAHISASDFGSGGVRLDIVLSMEPTREDRPAPLSIFAGSEGHGLTRPPIQASGPAQAPPPPSPAPVGEQEPHGGEAGRALADAGAAKDGGAVGAASLPETFVTPAEKIAAIGGVIRTGRPSDTRLELRIEVESVAGRPASQPTRESA